MKAYSLKLSLLFLMLVLVATSVFAQERTQPVICSVWTINGKAIKGELVSQDADYIVLKTGEKEVTIARSLIVRSEGLDKIQKIEDEVKIFLKNGDRLKGNITNQEENYYVVETQSLGEIQVKKSEVRKIKYFEARDPLKYYHSQAVPHTMTSNGYGLKKGDVYYRNIGVIYNQITIGASDYTSLGAGIIPLPLFGGRFSFWFNPKVSFPLKKGFIHASAGAFLMKGVASRSSSQEGFFLPVLHSSLTFGSVSDNFTIGGGIAPGTNLGALMLGFRKSTGRKGMFYNENLFMIQNDSKTEAISSLGYRRIYRRIGFDVMAIANTSYDYGKNKFRIDIIPMIGLIVPMQFKID